MNINPEMTELRELVRQTVEMVNQNARDNAFLRGAFEQMDKRLDNLTESMNQRLEQIDRRLDTLETRFEARMTGIESQLNAQLRWVIGLMAPMYIALIALVVKVFLGP